MGTTGFKNTICQLSKNEEAQPDLKILANLLMGQCQSVQVMQSLYVFESQEEQVRVILLSNLRGSNPCHRFMKNLFQKRKEYSLALDSQVG